MNPDICLENLQKDKALNELCTFGIGGPAKYYLEARSVATIQAALIWARQEKIPFFILGKGSNCLFDDRGFEGLVISNKIDFIENLSNGVFHVGGGYSFSLLGVQTARQHWSGLEFASGIPASVGGAIFMNAGANGGETANALTSVDYVTEEGLLQVIKKEELQFAYRYSSFQKMKGAIVGATFTLFPSSEARTKQIEIVLYRKKTQPYGDKSAGCVFRNPLKGHAGALIDQAGLKGTFIGGAQVSPMHANFIVNKGNATSQDVQALIAAIKEHIRAETGMELESEVRIVPYRMGQE